MRIALFHNASLLGTPVATRLVEDGGDEIVLVSPRSTPPDPALDALVTRHGLEHHRVADLHDRALFARLGAFAPDLLLVASLPWKVPRRLRALARLAALNLHPSLLPRYRGPLPEFWVIRDGEPSSGLTLHLMDDRFDAGPILAQAVVPIAPDDTLLSFAQRVYAPAPALVAEVVASYREGRSPPAAPQDGRLATYRPNVDERHLAIDWRLDAASIERLVRAADPLFEAFTTLDGERLHVASVRLLVSTRPLAPGEIALDHAQLVVGTGDGALAITRIGERPGHLHARDHGWPEGLVLGA